MPSPGYKLLTLTPRHGGLVVTFDGTLFGDAAGLAHDFSKLTEEDAAIIWFDMREVKFVDSYMIGLLIRLQSLKLRVDSRGVRLVAVVSSAEVREVFQITKMDRIIMVRNDFDPPVEPSAD